MVLKVRVDFGMICNWCQAGFEMAQKSFVPMGWLQVVSGWLWVVSKGVC